jgi:hypothetical protein
MLKVSVPTGSGPGFTTLLGALFLSERFLRRLAHNEESMLIVSAILKTSISDPDP